MKNISVSHCWKLRSPVAGPGRPQVNQKSGLFPTVDELRTTFEAAGIDLSDERPIVAYCNGGVARYPPYMWSNFEVFILGKGRR